VAMCSSLLEIDCSFNIILVLGIRMKNVTSLLCVGISAPTLCINTSDAGWAIMVCLAWHTCLFTDNLLSTTIETFLEIAHVNWPRNRD